MLRRARGFWRSGDDSARRGLDLTKQQWIGAFLIGLATVLAAFFGWRAAAIGSTAAFDDRQSISESIKVEQRDLNVTLAVIEDTRAYTRYLGEYAIADELDNQAGALAEAGDADAAAEFRREAQSKRRIATEEAAAEGVFGPFSIAGDLGRPTAEPRPFDFDAQVEAVAAQEATAFDSAGQLDPDFWAQDAEDIRERIEGLSIWTFVFLVAVLLLSIGQVNSGRHRFFYVFLGLGSTVILFGVIGGFTTDFFA